MRKTLISISLCLLALHTFAQNVTPKKEWGFKICYGPQFSFFKTYGVPDDIQQSGVSQLGIQKNVLGKCYGADIELKYNKWIFGISYSYNENSKKYNASAGDFPDSRYDIAFKLRNIEAGIAVFADRKINKSLKNELYLGLGHVFSKGDYQYILIVENPLQVGVYSYPSVEGGIVGRFRWEHNWRSQVKYGVELKVHYLYSVGSWTNNCFVPYIKVTF